MKKTILVAALFALAAAPAAGSSSARSSVASWYGPGLYGNTLACGGVLTTSTNGVAHKTLPCGTRLTVCYAGRCRRTTVVDRGPFVAGRELDLAAGLARSLRFSGVHRVTWWAG